MCLGRTAVCLTLIRYQAQQRDRAREAATRSEQSVRREEALRRIRYSRRDQVI